MYGGRESSTCCNWRKHMQIIKHQQIKKTSSSFWQHMCCKYSQCTYNQDVKQKNNSSPFRSSTTLLTSRHWTITGPSQVCHLLGSPWNIYIVICAICSVSIFSWVVSICSVFLYLVALWVFAARFCILLCCEYLQHFFCIWLHCEYFQHVFVFGCVVSICSVFLYLVALWVFAACFCIWLRCEYLQRVSVFGCVVSICSAFLHLVALWVFAVRFYIWLCCEYLQRFFCIWLHCEYFQHVFVFGCVVSICSVFLYFVFAAFFCIWLRFEYLQHVSVFGCVVSICSPFSAFGCIVSIFSTFLYLVALWVFSARFCIWLCCEFLQRLYLIIPFFFFLELWDINLQLPSLNASLYLTILTDSDFFPLVAERAQRAATEENTCK